MQSKFDPSILSNPSLQIHDDPYVKFIIDRRLHTGIEYYGVADCTLSLAYTEWEEISKYNRDWRGLKSASYNDSIDVTFDVEIPEKNDYRLEFLILRGPGYAGTLRPLYNDTPYGKTIDTDSPWDSQNWIKTRKIPCTAGTQTFGVRMSHGCKVGAFKLVPVVTCEGDSDGKYYGDNELNVNTADWSRNSINEVNNAAINMAFMDSYHQTDHNYSPWIFSLKDSLTILAGESRREAYPVFGGYLVGWVKKQKELTLHCQDSLLNLQNDLMYENYSIGTVPDEVKTYVQFSSVAETIKYMCETTLHHIDTYSVLNQNGFKVDFSSLYDYNKITTTGWAKERTATGTNPPYCLKLSKSSTGAASVVLYENNNNPCDMAAYPIFNMDYKALNSAAAMEFDICITMNTTGDPADDRDFYIDFTGPSGHSDTLTTVTPIFNDEWNYLSLNLPLLFETIISKEDHYYVSKIELVGTISSTSPAGEMYLNNILGYTTLSDTTRHSNEDVKSIFDIIQDLGEAKKYAIYLQPGLERCDDVVVAQPYQNSILPVVVSSASNLIECSEYGSMPLEDGFLNQAHTSFNISDSEVGTSFKENLDSVIHFEEIQKHEFDDNLKSQVDVDNATQKRADDLSSPNEYLNVTIQGNPFLEPYQDIYYAVDENRCSGYGMVKTITYGYDPNSSPKLKADLGINRSSRLYDDLLFKIYRDVYNINLTNHSGGDIYRSRII